MEQWRHYVRYRPRRYASNTEMDFLIARDNFLKALHYGNLDAACALGVYSEDIRQHAHSIEHFRRAAYCGHSYAMYRVAQYYDAIDRNVANACYRQAALWKYTPAMQVCNQRGIYIDVGTSIEDLTQQEKTPDEQCFDQFEDDYDASSESIAEQWRKTDEEDLMRQMIEHEEEERRLQEEQEEREQFERDMYLMLGDDYHSY